MYILYLNNGNIDILWQASAGNLYTIILGLEYFKVYMFIQLYLFIYLFQTILSLLSEKIYRNVLWMSGIFCFCLYHTEVQILHIDTNTDICKKEKKIKTTKNSFFLQDRNLPEIVMCPHRYYWEKKSF